jgi:ATP-dependent Lon protease
MSWARARAKDLSIPDDYFETHDVHVHVPEGSIPKDGPSAGITMATAMISCFTGRKVRRDVAMTGEITLRGEVLPIGGVKEKVLAARQAKIGTIVLPKLNRRDVQQIASKILHGIQFEYVDTMDEVLKAGLLPAEEPVAESPAPAAALPIRITPERGKPAARQP